MVFRKISRDRIKSMYIRSCSALTTKVQDTYVEQWQLLSRGSPSGLQAPSKFNLQRCMWAMVLTICMGIGAFFIFKLCDYIFAKPYFTHCYHYKEDLNVFFKRDYERALFYSYLYNELSEKRGGSPNLMGSPHFIEHIILEYNDKVMSCYYNLPTNFTNLNELQPSMIPSYLCTHINIAFVQIVNKTLYITENVAYGIRLIVELKKSNPDLKILLSVGGAGTDNGFPKMVIDHASRKVFIRSIITTIKEFNLDGVDLDWEFPAVHGINPLLTKGRERQHFSQLLREIRTEFKRHKRIYLLTVAAAAPQIIVDAAYDVDQLNLYVDYVNVMTYDYHFYTTYTPFTGLNAPLFARKNEEYYLSTLNINYTVNMYIGKGLQRDKIVVGVPTYGHTFYLVNSNNAGVNSPASGYGSLGSLGFVSYPTVCRFIRTYKENVIVNNETDAKVPYMHKDHEWVSYDDRYSVMEKAKYIRDNGLRGAMVYSLNSDDFHGDCQFGGKSEFPLTYSIKKEFKSDHV